MKRISYLVIGTLLLLLLGLIYAWSVFISPIETELGWDRSQTSMIFTISIITFCLGGILGGYISGKKSPRLSMLLSAICLFAGFLLSSKVAELWAIYLSYGVLVGLGVGLSYNALINTVTKWFPDKKGLSSGILLMGFGMGSFLLGTLAANLMTEVGWREVFLGISILLSILILAGALVLRLPDESHTEKYTGKLNSKKTGRKSLSNPSGVGSGSQMDSFPDISTKDMLKTSRFWSYFIWSLLLVASGLVIVGHAAAAATDLGASAGSAAMIMGIVSIFNGVGRIVLGAVYDKVGLMRTLTPITVCAIISPLLLIGSSQMASLPLMCIGFVFTGLFYGGVPTMNSTFSMDVFGQKNFAVNFSIVNSSLLIAPVAGAYIAGTLRTVTGSYLSSYIMMLVFGCISIVWLFILKKSLNHMDNHKREIGKAL